jgi:DNA-binding transcriptional LysR family regulator
VHDAAVDTRDLDHLVAVAQAGSLSGAAKRAGVAVSTVSRRLDALEAALKVRLIDRRADGARLTPDGERLAAMAEPLVTGAARLARSAEAMRSGRSGAVRVSATEFVIADILAPALPALWAAHPGVKIVLKSQAEVVSLAARDADVAVRMTRPEGNSLVAKRLPELRLGLWASPAYLAGRDPAALRLADERLLVYDDSYGRLPELDWVDSAALEGAVALRTGSTRALLAATAAGAGVGLLAARFAHRAGLVEVPAPSPLPTRAPWLVVHRDLQRLPPVRAVRAWIESAFRSGALSPRSITERGAGPAARSGREA